MRIRRQFANVSSDPFFHHLMEARRALVKALETVPPGYDKSKRVAHAIGGCLEILDSMQGLGSKLEIE